MTCSIAASVLGRWFSFHSFFCFPLLLFIFKFLNVGNYVCIINKFINILLSDFCWYSDADPIAFAYELNLIKILLFGM